MQFLSILTILLEKILELLTFFVILCCKIIYFTLFLLRIFYSACVILPSKKMGGNSPLGSIAGGLLGSMFKK